jgi:hypothetical protein
MARKKATAQKQPATQELIDSAIAHTVAEGNMVGFRFLFDMHSPLRQTSSEDIRSERYAYLLPNDENNALYQAALNALTTPLRTHIQAQLEKKGPAQLPSELLLLLADNAMRIGKYTTAARAYELLRVRRRMQELFYTQADEALDKDNLPLAVKGYRIATALDYDYAAFPEPMPVIPNYHTRALMLHADYPKRPEDALARQPLEIHVTVALHYLLLNDEAAARLQARPIEQRIAFIRELVTQRDPEWPVFAERYRESHKQVMALGERFKHAADGEDAGLAEEIEEQQARDECEAIPTQLLGRTLEGGSWWQYLKELAYKHPAAVLFISRQLATRDLEILIPVRSDDSPLAQELGLS